MKKIILLWLLTFTLNSAYSQTLCNGVTQQTASVTDGAHTITFNFDCVASTYTVSMVGPDNEWMGILFGTSMNAGSNAFLYTDVAGTGAIRSYYVSGYSTPSATTNHVLTTISDNTSGGVRTVTSGPRPFDTSDPQELTFSTASTSINVRLPYHGGGNLNLSQHQVSGNGSFLSTTLILDSSLPLDVLDFDLSIEDKKILIDWSVDNIINVESMYIQRSMDGKSWEDLSKFDVEKAEHFSFLDENPYPANNYYRIKVVDRDGSVDYSYVKSVIMPITTRKEGLITFGPNPFQDRLNIMVSPGLELSDLVQISLTDATYSTVYKETLPLQDLKQIDLSHLASGYYYMVVAHTDWIQVDRLVKN